MDKIAHLHQLYNTTTPCTCIIMCIYTRHLYVHVHVHVHTGTTIYDRIDAAATINFSTQFGVATIRERCLFESGVSLVRRGYRLNEKVNTSTRIVY